ncbi:MAG: type transporter [Sporolactobacillus laevolacticus]|jgi:ABC-2 type transport system permease protein|nr:type transporter [Sporolactobacillus laevolacticus]
MSSALKVVFSSLNVHRKQSLARTTFQFCVIFQPFLLSFFLYIMLKGSDPVYAGQYIVISSGLMSLWSSIIFSSAGDIDRERYMGTLECIYAAPSDFRVTFFGHVLGNLLLGLLSMAISYVCVVFIYRLPVPIAHPIEFIISFVLAIGSFAMISMLFGLLFTLSRNARILMNCLEYPIYILCGLVFPIDVLPMFLRIIAYALSPTWAVLLLRESMSGKQNWSQFFTQSLILFLLITAYFLFVVLLFKKMDHRVRMSGTLGVH